MSDQTPLVAIVTDASSGVGRYAALVLVVHSWHVVVVACRCLPKARKAAAGLRIAPQHIPLLLIDLGLQARLA